MRQRDLYKEGKQVESIKLKRFLGNIKKQDDTYTAFEIYIHENARFEVALLNSKIWVTKGNEPNKDMLEVHEDYAAMKGLI